MWCNFFLNTQRHGIAHLCIILASQTDVSLLNTSTVTVLVTEAFCCTVMANITKVTLADVWFNACAMWFTTIAAGWLTLVWSVGLRNKINLPQQTEYKTIVLIITFLKLCLALVLNTYELYGDSLKRERER